MSRDLSARIPDDWYWKDSITLLRGDGEANVIFSSEAIAPDTDLREYVESTVGAERREFPGYREVTLEDRAVIGGRPGALHTFEWFPADGPPVTHMQAYAVDGGRAYTATTSCPSTIYARLRPELLAVLSSLSIGPERRGGLARAVTTAFMVAVAILMVVAAAFVLLLLVTAIIELVS